MSAISFAMRRARFEDMMNTVMDRVRWHGLGSTEDDEAVSNSMAPNRGEITSEEKQPPFARLLGRTVRPLRS